MQTIRALFIILGGMAMTNSYAQTTSSPKPIKQEKKALTEKGTDTALPPSCTVLAAANDEAKSAFSLDLSRLDDETQHQRVRDTEILREQRLSEWERNLLKKQNPR